MNAHVCNFNTAGVCVQCGIKMALPEPSTTAPRESYFPEGWPKPIDPRLNLGSPIGPGFVVYERAPGAYGYDRKMALDSVGKGWAGLINQLFDRIEWDAKHNGGRFMGKMIVTQVKEKFGALRIYWGMPNDGDHGYGEGFIGALESVSTTICEDCGKPGTIGGRGWIRTMCEECRTPKTHTEQVPDA